LARRWLSSVIPEEVALLLNASEHFAGFIADRAYAETKTQLDNFEGATRETMTWLSLGKLKRGGRFLTSKAKRTRASVTRSQRA